MNRSKIMPVVVGMLALLFSLSPEAWGGKGSTAGGSTACVVDNPGGGSVALRTTAAVEALNLQFDLFGNVLNTPQDVDITLRVERGGQTEFFRLRLFQILDFTLLPNEAVACLFLDPAAPIAPTVADTLTNQHTVQDLILEVLNRFGLQAKQRLVITSKSITNTQPFEVDKTIPQDPTHGSSLADATVYAQ